MCILCELGINNADEVEDRKEEIIEALLNSEDVQGMTLHHEATTPHAALRWMVKKLDAVQELPDSEAMHIVNAEIRALDPEDLIHWLTQVQCILDNMGQLQRVLAKRLVTHGKVIAIDRDTFQELIAHKKAEGN